MTASRVNTYALRFAFSRLSSFHIGIHPAAALGALLRNQLNVFPNKEGGLRGRGNSIDNRFCFDLLWGFRGKGIEMGENAEASAPDWILGSAAG